LCIEDRKDVVFLRTEYFNLINLYQRLLILYDKLPKKDLTIP